jgi:hypothetical protein
MVENRSRGDGEENWRKWRRAWAQMVEQSRPSAVIRCSCCTARSFSASLGSAFTLHRDISQIAFRPPPPHRVINAVRRCAMALFETRARIFKVDTSLDVSSCWEEIQMHRGWYHSPGLAACKPVQARAGERHHSNFRFWRIFGDWKKNRMSFP